jgi:hypothetical protein
VNPPIIIPAQGGTFEYDVSLANNGAAMALFDAWIMQYTPQGYWQGPMLGPINLTVPATVVVSRLRSQSVPDTAPPGVYTYRGYVGIYSAARWDSSSFTYTKSTARDGGTTMSYWANSGESFEPYLTVPAASSQPSAFSLKSVCPNPFNPATAISYELPTASYTSLKVYDVSGRMVANLVDGWQEAGSHQATFNGSRLSSGLYFVKMQAGDYSAVKKMVLVK